MRYTGAMPAGESDDRKFHGEEAERPALILGRTSHRVFDPVPPRAIEQPDFPFERLSELAELESWRKEIHRPIYHVHKWWAQRLGSVFRGALIGAATTDGADVETAFRSPVRLDGHVVFDPFAGSGTIVGEAHKLGARAVGIDINPVAIRAIRTALGPLERKPLDAAFQTLREEVETSMRGLHATTDAAGRPAEALYWFWVKQLPCPACSKPVDLFATRIFAQHAYVKKHPTVRASCPGCGDVVTCLHSDQETTCPTCNLHFNPRRGPVDRATATCPHCQHGFRMVDAARAYGQPPPHRLYAKLIVGENGNKAYLKPTEADLAAYAEAEATLEREAPLLPQLPIEPGHNTRQILAYNYRYWRDVFNARQLLGLGRLAAAIRKLPDSWETRALGILFSGTLEFNNLFATYKGEGTGAVRHMFAHHILKPERRPIEANPWGTDKSSGAFATLYKRRLLRALEYRAAPFEVLPSLADPKKGEKIFGLSLPIGGPLVSEWPKGGLPERGIMLSPRDARDSGLPARSVDLVVTDPPYFDNVHYSELADFFEAWTPVWSAETSTSTRQPGEVQDVDAVRFSDKLRGVLTECVRVMKDDGLLVMSYHHAREEGWLAIGRALLGAGLTVTEAHPVKAELSRATPKARAKAPIDIDVLIVARKATADDRRQLTAARALSVAADRAARRAERYRRRVRPLSAGDARVLLSAQLLVSLSPGRSPDALEEALRWTEPQMAPLVRALLEARPLPDPGDGPMEQLTLFPASANRSAPD